MQPSILIVDDEGDFIELLKYRLAGLGCQLLVASDGIQALTLARTRDNRCNAASNDLTREGYQQKILNAIKSRLLSPSIFFHLPWASWAAPKAVRTDMGGLTLLTLFFAAETGGSAPTRILGENNLPLADPQSASGQAAVHRAVAKLMNG